MWGLVCLGISAQQPVIVSSFSSGHSKNDPNDPLFDVDVCFGDGKGGVGPMTIKLTSQKVDCCIDGSIKYHTRVGNIHP